MTKKKLPKNSRDVYDPPLGRARPSKKWWLRGAQNRRWKCTDCGAEFHERTEEKKLFAHFSRYASFAHNGGHMMPQGGAPWEGRTTRVSNNVGDWRAQMLREDIEDLGYKPHYW